jgi:WD40 repeat protein
VIDLRERRETQVMQQRSKGIYAILPVPRERLLCAGGDGTLTVYHVDQALIHQRTIPLCDAKLRGFAIQASGALLAAACGDGTVRVLDTDHFNEHHTLHAHEGGALAVTFHPTKPALVSAGKDGHLRLWHVEESFRELLALPAHRSAIYQVAFNGAGTICATAGRDKSAKCWRADTFDPLARLERSSGGHSHSVNAVNWIGDHLITAGDDRTILAWDLRP